MFLPFVLKFYKKLLSDFKMTEITSHVELWDMQVFLTELQLYNKYAWKRILTETWYQPMERRVLSRRF
jgi:hypothetical protein